MDFPDYKAYVLDRLTDRMAPLYHIEEEVEKMCWDICKPFYRIEATKCPEPRYPSPISAVVCAFRVIPSDHLPHLNPICLQAWRKFLFEREKCHFLKIKVAMCVQDERSGRPFHPENSCLHVYDSFLQFLFLNQQKASPHSKIAPKK